MTIDQRLACLGLAGAPCKGKPVLPALCLHFLRGIDMLGQRAPKCQVREGQEVGFRYLTIPLEPVGMFQVVLEKQREKERSIALL